MKKLLTLILLFIFNLFAITNLNAQFSNKLYSGINQFLSLEYDNDKNIVVSTTDFTTKTIIIKTDSTNQITLWKKQLFDNSHNSLIKVFQQNIYIISNRLTTPTSSVILTKLDFNGNYVWSKVIRTNNNLEIHSMVVANQTRDIFLGFGSCGYENAIVKLDSLGNFVWCNLYVPINGYGGAVQDLKEDSQGHILVLSHCTLNPYSKRIPLLFTIDLNGNVLWNKFYPSLINNGQRISSLTIDSKKNIYFENDLCGANSQINKNSIYKTDSLGNLQWTKYYTFPYLETSLSLALTIDSKDNLYYLGNGADTLGSARNINFLKINSINGAVKNSWIDTGSIFSLIFPQYIKCINPNKIALAGFKNNFALIAGVDSSANGVCVFSPANVISTSILSYDTTGGFMIVPKSPFVVDTILTINSISVTSSIFCVADGINENINNPKWEVYPNPFTNELIISNDSNEEFKLCLYNLLGDKIISETSTETVHLNTSQLAKGMYIYELRNKKGIIKNGKIIRQ